MGHPAPSSGPNLPAEGIYRYRRLVGGHPLWYAIDWTGEIVALFIARQGESQAEIVVELHRMIRGESDRPRLKLIDPSSEADRSRASVFLGAAASRQQPGESRALFPLP